MPQYQYLAKNMEGKTIQEIEESPSDQALIDKLQGQGYFVISLSPIHVEAPKPESKKSDKAKKDSFTHTAVTMEDIFEEVVGEIYDEDDDPNTLLSMNSRIRTMNLKK